MKCTYYTDGAATMLKKSNKYLREAGGWAYIKIKDSEITDSNSGGCPLTTNNEMELYAIYASLLNFSETAHSDDIVEICSDSSYSINIFTNWIESWKKNNWKNSKNKTVENKELIQSIDKVIHELKNNNCRVEFRKVKGHGSNQLNQKVDNLAVEAKKFAKTSQETTGYKNENKILGKKIN